MSKSVLHLDLHHIAKNNKAITEALHNGICEAESKKLKAIEIIPGKGSGQLMLRVKKFLEQKDIKQRYKRYQVDKSNHGRMFVYFK